MSVPITIGACGSSQDRALWTLYVAVGALALTVVLISPGHAGEPGGERAATHAPLRPPAAIHQPAAAARPVARDAQAKPSPAKSWSLEDALPDNSLSDINACETELTG